MKSALPEYLRNSFKWDLEFVNCTTTQWTSTASTTIIATVGW